MLKNDVTPPEFFHVQADRLEQPSPKAAAAYAEAIVDTTAALEYLCKEAEYLNMSRSDYRYARTTEGIEAEDVRDCRHPVDPKPTSEELLHHYKNLSLFPTTNFKSPWQPRNSGTICPFNQRTRSCKPAGLVYSIWICWRFCSSKDAPEENCHTSRAKKGLRLKYSCSALFYERAFHWSASAHWTGGLKRLCSNLDNYTTSLLCSRTKVMCSYAHVFFTNSASRLDVNMMQWIRRPESVVFLLARIKIRWKCNVAYHFGGDRFAISQVWSEKQSQVHTTLTLSYYPLCWVGKILIILHSFLFINISFHGSAPLMLCSNDVFRCV